jgi:MFS family permease
MCVYYFTLNLLGVEMQQHIKPRLTPDIAAIEPISLWKPIVLYLTVSLFLFFEMAVQVSPAVMSASLMHDLNINTFSLGLMSGFYFYSYTLMQIPSGLLLDKYNPRIIITISLVICALGTFLFAMAGNFYIASIARILMGLGSAFAFVSVLVVTADLFESKYFATITGFTQMLAALGAIAGELPAAVLESSIGWRNTMLVFSAIGISLALMVFKFLKYKRYAKYSNQLNSKYSNTKSNLGKIISQPQTWYVAAYACLSWAPMSGFASLWGIPFIMNADHLSQDSAAFICSLMWVGLAFASPLLGAISNITKNKTILFSIMSILSVVSLYFVVNYTLSIITLSVLIFFAGASCAGQALSFSIINENSDKTVKATALAFNNMAVVISGAIFQPLIGKLIDLNNPAIGLSHTVEDYRIGLSVLIVSSLISFVIATFLFNPKTTERYENQCSVYRKRGVA